MKKIIISITIVWHLLLFFGKAVFAKSSDPKKHNPKSGPQIQITITSSFAWSKKVWGTYKLTNETTRAFSKDSRTNRLKKITSLKTKRPIGNLILKKGRMFLLRPVSDERITNILVKDFPYKRRKSKISVNFGKKQNDLFDLYEDRINQIIKGNAQLSQDYYPIDINSINFNQMECTRKPNRIECSLPITIQKPYISEKLSYLGKV